MCHANIILRYISRDPPPEFHHSLLSSSQFLNLTTQHHSSNQRFYPFLLKFSLSKIRNGTHLSSSPRSHRWSRPIPPSRANPPQNKLHSNRSIHRPNTPAISLKSPNFAGLRLERRRASRSLTWGPHSLQRHLPPFYLPTHKIY
jgi:hypothetical protein